MPHCQLMDCLATVHKERDWPVMAKNVHPVKKVNLDQEVKSSTTGTCGLRMAQNLLKVPTCSITVNLHGLLTLNMCASPGKQVVIIMK